MFGLSITELLTFMLFLAVPATIIFAPYFYLRNRSRKKEIEAYARMTPEQRQLEAVNISNKLKSYETSHVLHFFMCFPTGGLWLIVWFLVAQHNSAYRTKYHNTFKNLSVGAGASYSNR